MHYYRTMTASRRSHLTVRNVPPRIAAALRAESRRRGQSLNQTVVELLAAATGVGQDPPLMNGLQDLAGTWSQEEFASIEAALADADRVDPEMWQ